MTCSCIKRVEENVRKVVEASLGDVVESVKVANTGFVVADSGLISTLNIPIRIKADKTGYRAKNGKETTLVANYCPFCGEKTAYARATEGEQ